MNRLITLIFVFAIIISCSKGGGGDESPAPVTPVVVTPRPDVPTVIEPVEFPDGVTDVTVLKVLDPKTVEFAAGPVITSVCTLSDKSVPTIVKV